MSKSFSNLSLTEEIDQLRYQITELTLKTLNHQFITPEPITISPYNGNILNWLMFWTTYQSQITYNTQLSDCSKFRILYNNLDLPTQALLLSDIDPRNPNIKLAIERIESHFSNDETIRYEIEQSISSIPLIKDSGNNYHWFALLEAAKKTTVLINGRLASCWDDYFARLLNQKLAPIHRNRIWDQILKEQRERETLPDTIHYIEYMIRVNRIRKPVDHHEVSEQLCPLCELDYHYAENCDHYRTVDERRDVVRDRAICRRCLVARFVRGHNCGQMCSKCQSDHHHVALCMIE